MTQIRHGTNKQRACDIEASSTSDKGSKDNSYNLMQLFLKTSGETLPIEIEDGFSLVDFKEHVERQTGIPVSMQRLVHAGRHLDTGSIGMSGVEEGSTIWCLLRLRGGQMGIFVKVLGGKSLRIDGLSGDTSMAELQQRLLEQEKLEPGKYELMFQGQKLELTSTLASVLIEGDSTLEMVLPIRVPKGRCALTGCVDRVAKIVGECRYCGHGYCSKHRLPESHVCDNLNGCKQQSYEKNSSKLLGEKCVADRV